MTEKNNPRILRAWTYFDCANSAHSLVIGTAVFPAFFSAVAPETINLWGSEIKNSSLLAYALTISYLFIAITQPILSGIADAGGRRKIFMQIFTVIGAVACISMFFMGSAEYWQVGFWAYIVSMIGYAGGVVFNNSYMPLIATPDKYDALSSRGFTLGYIGGTILLIINLICIMYWDTLGFPDKGIATRLAFVTVGIWWLGFSLIPFLGLPNDEPIPLKKGILSSGFKELRKTWEKVQHIGNLKSFLAAFFFYDAGVQTIIFLASVFAQKELGFETTELIILVMLLQIVAAVGAWLFAKISEIKGNKFTLMTMLIVWTLIAFSAFLIRDKMSFYGLGVFLGIVLGGIQSLSRSAFSKLMPRDTKDVTTFYAFYDLTDKLAVVFGTFLFGYIDQLIGLRYSVLAMAILFVIGAFLLRGVSFDEEKQTKI